jgi:hypothetical protein
MVRTYALHARYLMNISTFSDAHASLMSAASTALHLGLHLDDTALQGIFTEADLYERRKVFAGIYMMECSLAYTLGLPRTLQHADYRQTLSLRDEEYRDEGAAMIASQPTSPIAETVLNQKCHRIYAKLIDHRAARQSESSESVDWVASVEQDLSAWQRALPSLPEASHDGRALLGQLILRLIHVGAQLMLYSPFLHHSARSSTDPDYSAAGFEYASAGVRAATQVILLNDTMYRHRLMHEAYWLYRYTLVWATCVLAYFVIHAKARVTIEESRAAALKGRELLRVLGLTNSTAKRMEDCIDAAMEAVAAIES